MLRANFNGRFLRIWITVSTGLSFSVSHLIWLKAGDQ
jgi:hypothetical protein